jgi:hypothetical protein
MANVGPFFGAYFNRIEARRLAAHSMHTGGNNFDVLSVAQQAAKKPFRNRTAADITRADKEDAFHNSESASERNSNLKSNWSKSILPMNKDGAERSEEPVQTVQRFVLTT